MLRASIPGRDPVRELRLEWVQLRELTRYLGTIAGDPTRLADTLGLAENLGRRLSAHAAEMDFVYYPASAPLLAPAEWDDLSGAALD